MYQLEVKRYLVEREFPPDDEWEVTVHVDPMELGDDRDPGKKKRAGEALRWLRKKTTVGEHSDFGRVDVVAKKRGQPTFLVEVEGESQKQKEQALYSALGQILLTMKGNKGFRYGIAVPDDASWECQTNKIPADVCERLSLTLWLVGKTEVREVTPTP